MKRCLLVLAALVTLGCVDTWEPTGPVPTPDPPSDPGDLTASVVATPTSEGTFQVGSTARRIR